MTGALSVPSPADRCADIRRMVAKRGWSEELERIASYRVAIAMEASGMVSFRPERRINDVPRLCLSC